MHAIPVVLSSLTGSPREKISRMAVQRHLQKGPEWSNFIHETDRTQLEYKYRVMCNQDYYGPGCSTLCTPRDDHFGHYRCNETGEKVCLDGWTGQYCAEGRYTRMDTIWLKFLQGIPSF